MSWPATITCGSWPASDGDVSVTLDAGYAGYAGYAGLIASRLAPAMDYLQPAQKQAKGTPPPCKIA